VLIAEDRRPNLLGDTQMQADTLPMPPILCSVEDAGTALCLSRSEIYRLIDREEIQSVKIGKRRLILRNSLESFVASLAAAAELAARTSKGGWQ